MILRSNLAQTILYDPAHPVSIAMKKMQDIPENMEAAVESFKEIMVTINGK